MNRIFIASIMTIFIFTLSACVKQSVVPKEPISSVLILAPFKILYKNDTRGLEMTETGQIKSPDGRDIGKIDTKGIVYDVDGNRVASLTMSGKLEDSNGHPLVSVNEDGILDNGSGMLVYWSEDGHLMKDNEQGGVILSPPNSPARRAASIVVFLYLSFVPTN